MVLDSSAIVAIHLKEPGCERLLDVIDTAVGKSEALVIGVPTLLETAMVLTARLGQDARPLLSVFLRRIDAEVVAFQQEHLDAAMMAFLRFGRGRHPAALNFGDCMAYAVASVAGMPLLFTGGDFSRTDIDRA
ncbi:MAG TPA: type II toxin-antitoxin system VapC family toxin [Bryobacteraceae bacterium]